MKVPGTPTKFLGVALVLVALFLILNGRFLPAAAPAAAPTPTGGASAGSGPAPVLATAPAPPAAGNAAGGPPPATRPSPASGASRQGATSFDLIDRDIAGGQLSAEQGLLYKVFSQFSDARLPAQYVGAGNGRVGDLIMEEVAEQAATLSASAKQTLAPFFIPPSQPGSWYYLPRLGATAAAPPRRGPSAAVAFRLNPAAAPPQPANPADWAFKPAAGGKIRIYHLSANADAADKAKQLAAEFDRTIWSSLTTLMDSKPLPNEDGATNFYLWDSYIKNNGTVVPFTNDAHVATLGITIGSSCAGSAVNIYLPDNLPVGSLNSPGLLQYATHEFMHAIQFSLKIQSCPGYIWLKEATATWAEDYVYPDAQSEHDVARKYLWRTEARLDDRQDLHDYGAYLLFYFLTHKIDPSAAVVKYVWQNAAKTANSYQAVDDGVKTAAPTYRETYWPLFLAALFNYDPYQTYYKAKDGLTDGVALEDGPDKLISTPKGEQETPLPAELPTGGAVFYERRFLDSSVRSLTILNGLGYKLSKGDASADVLGADEGDQTYLLEDLASAEDGEGVTVELLLKAKGQDAPSAGDMTLPTIINSGSVSSQAFGYCLDAQGPLEEVVVILANADFAHPDRIMKPEGLPVTIWANNIPCWKVQGTFTALDFDDGVTEQSQGTVTFGWPKEMPAPKPYQNVASLIFPQTQLTLLSANASWSNTGRDSAGCTYSGSGNWSGSESANDYLNLAQGLLSASPNYRGYSGDAGADPETVVSTEVACPDEDPYTEDGYPIALYFPLSESKPKIKVDASGKLSGEVTLENYDQRYQRFKWDLTGQKK
jgi:hypothetical protein